MTAFVELVVVDEIGIRPLRPAPWSRIEFVREDAHGDRDGDALSIENPLPPILPVETGARKRRVLSQVIVMLSRMSSRVRPSAFL